jgi:DNA invertase Pin-like site-specific DNA recombinase
MIAGLYVRVSTAEQETTGQIAALRQWAAAFGFETKVYKDEAQSGHKAKRPAFNRLQADAAAGKLGVIVAWRLDRLGRSIQNVVAAVKDLEAAGVRVVTLEGYDSQSDCAPLMLGILSGWAESESRRISARVRLNIGARRSRGERVGRIPTHEITSDKIKDTANLTVRAAADALGVSAATIVRARRKEPKAL